MTVDEKRAILIQCCSAYERVKCSDCVMRMECHFRNVSDNDINDMFGYVAREKSAPEPDNVNHPAHYQGAHECIEVMKAMFGVEAVKAFCRCNAFKYRFRAVMKNGEEDIRKAEWYEDYLIKLIEQEGGNDTDRT